MNNEQVIVTLTEETYSLLRNILQIVEEGLEENSGFSQDVIDQLYSAVPER